MIGQNRLKHIVAFDSQRGFARFNQNDPDHGVIPWDIPSDLAFFHEMTSEPGAAIVVGRLTFEAMGGRGLKGRDLHVISSKPVEESDRVTAHSSLEGCLGLLAPGSGSIWIAGGQDIYEQTISRADDLYITEVDGSYGCQRFYPEIPDYFKMPTDATTDWQTENGYRFRRQTFKRTDA